MCSVSAQRGCGAGQDGEAERDVTTIFIARRFSHTDSREFLKI